MKIDPRQRFVPRISQGSRIEIGKRWHIALEVSLVAFLSSAGLGCFIARANDAQLKGYVTVVGVPACAAALFVAIACFFGDVIDTPKIVFPLNVTLPLVFCSLLPVASVLISTPERGLLAPQETMLYAHIWQQPLNLGIVFLGLVAALSLLSLLSSRSTR